MNKNAYEQLTEEQFENDTEAVVILTDYKEKGYAPIMIILTPKVPGTTFVQVAKPTADRPQFMIPGRPHIIEVNMDMANIKLKTRIQAPVGEAATHMTDKHGGSVLTPKGINTVSRHLGNFRFFIINKNQPAEFNNLHDVWPTLNTQREYRLNHFSWDTVEIGYESKDINVITLKAVKIETINDISTERNMIR